MAPFRDRGDRVQQRLQCESDPSAAALGVGHTPTSSLEVRRVAFGFDERVPQRLKHNLRGAKEMP
jgi:5-oxopent-3-ene-1,2,5-tricarboxylate decarboxylase/2-hydroxyhepta-2,4-diene-1,7-dioate isomerase